MTDILKNKYLWTVAGTLFVLFLIHLCSPKTEVRYADPIKLTPKDTTHPKEFKPEPEAPILVPDEVQEFKVVKKAKRKAIEKQAEIIEQVVIENKPMGGEELKVTKIDTAGNESTEVFNIPEGAKEEIVDSTGAVHFKDKTKAGRIIQKIGKGSKNVLIVTGGAAVVAVTAIVGAPVVAVASVGVATAALVVVIIKTDK
jgi:hypothetical protein